MLENKKSLPDCRYYQWVCCDGRTCQYCGWHPDVEALRKEQLGMQAEEK